MCENYIFFARFFVYFAKASDVKNKLLFILYRFTYTEYVSESPVTADLTFAYRGQLLCENVFSDMIFKFCFSRSSSGESSAAVLTFSRAFEYLSV